MSVHHAPSMLIRDARGIDGPALARIAALDSRTVPGGDVLVAEADGEVVAALAIATGEYVADPFRRTADAVALLRLRAERMRETPRRARVRLALRPA